MGFAKWIKWDAARRTFSIAFGRLSFNVYAIGEPPSYHARRRDDDLGVFPTLDEAQAACEGEAKRLLDAGADDGVASWHWAKYQARRDRRRPRLQRSHRR
jgi:hypothetical protein